MSSSLGTTGGILAFSPSFDLSKVRIFGCLGHGLPNIGLNPQLLLGLGLLLGFISLAVLLGLGLGSLTSSTLGDASFIQIR